MIFKYIYVLIGLFISSLLHAQQMRQGRIIYEKTTVQHESPLNISGLFKVPENRINSLLILDFDEIYGKTIEIPDNRFELMRDYSTYLQDSLVIYFNWNTDLYYITGLDYDKEPIAYSRAIIRFKGIYEKRRKKILGFKCRQVTFFDKDRQITAWVTDEIYPFIGPGLFLASPQGIILAWKDNIGNKGEAISIEADNRNENRFIQLPADSKVYEADERISNKSKKELKIGDILLDFAVYDIEGNSLSKYDLEGTVIVFNFWFVACAPCRAEIPHLNKFVDKYPNVKFIGLSFESKNRIIDFTEKVPFKYNLVPNAKFLLETWGIESFPQNILVDQKGIIRFIDKDGDVNALEQAIQNYSN